MAVENNIPEGWAETSIGKVTVVESGGTPSTKNSSYWGDEIPWITPRDLSSFKGVFIGKGERSISIEGLENSSAKLLPKNTILFSSRAPIGYVVIAQNETATNQGFKNLICDEVNSHYKYFYYLMKYKSDYIERLSSGSTFSEASGTLIKSIELNLPPLQEQKAIAKVLTAFDDKIELLQAQNKTLETMAQTIFKEWFGKYQIGDELPEGWRVGKLGDIANLKSGYAFKSKDFVEESSKKALKIKDLKGDGKVSLNAVSCVSNDVTKLSRVQYFRLKEGDIVLAMSGNTTGKIGVIPPHSNEVYLNQRVGKFFMIKQDLNSFLYSFLMSGNYEEKILKMGYGSAQPNISPSQIENIDIIYPNEEKLVSFLNISNPIFNKVLDNNNQIQSLTETRDTLLPKLMSGQVRVNNIKQTADA
ncbi:restriction endonuclease subunit S [Flavobacteriaceae bacterium]|nr:restriction endonuclease subunit S [Flavobacteriaceae bacterium]